MTNDDETCAICLASYRDSCVRVLPCDHTFHRHCLDSWERRSNACPCCRVPIKPQDEALVTVLNELRAALETASRAAVKLRTVTEADVSETEQAKDVIKAFDDLSGDLSMISRQLTGSGNNVTRQQPSDAGSFFRDISTFGSDFIDTIATHLPRSYELDEEWTRDLYRSAHEALRRLGHREPDGSNESPL